jgi:serine protease AprX
MSIGDTNLHDHSHAQNRFAVIPTAKKLSADPRYSARGVRIAFLDSGFYPHPDFASRVVEFHDIAGEETSFGSIDHPQSYHWHGTQTVTACAGDGSLSDGVYSGIARKAELVLVKVSRAGRIGDREIEAGLRWVLDNRERLNVRILNISLGGDCDLPSAKSRINRFIEELTKNGVVVVVAAGNSAETRSTPPASAPSAITVGGYSDENNFNSDSFGLYHSSHGETADGIVKPEIIAPAMFVAAPILPDTPDFAAAEKLSLLQSVPNYSFGVKLQENFHVANLSSDVLEADIESARIQVDRELSQRKVVATHYQHVDGTSFAAPIVSSVVAQMLEANPKLTPVAVKNILISSAMRLGGHPAIRQGFGIVNAALAVELAENESHSFDNAESHPPKIVGKKIIFRFHNDFAASVDLAGDFNDWQQDALLRCASGIWEIAVDCRPADRYRYKFLIDGAHWTEDPSHGLKEEDGFGGFNSVLLID